jgi:ADP-ribose pyrophosphatase YjhB (NUDIX family)
MEPQWLQWAKRLQAIGQNGLTFAKAPFDIERYQALQEIALEIMAEGAQADITQLRDIFSQEVGYATPKVGVRGVVFRENALLLVKERSDGLWTLPGGWVDIGESPSEAAVREIYEESGYQTRAIKLLGVYDRKKHNPHPPSLYDVYKLFFQCEILSGKPTTSIETTDVAFFSEDEIPKALSLRRTTPAQIKRMFEHYRNPHFETDYD